MSWKKSPFLIFQILGLLVNTLAADEMYPLFVGDYLTIPIQMQFQFKLKKTFSHLFAGFLKFW